MPDARPYPAHHLKAACSNCSVLGLCLPPGLSGPEVEQLDTLIVQRVKVKKGAALYRAGDPLRSLYAVRIGSFKTCVLSQEGREHVTGFKMPGEMLGLDAISTSAMPTRWKTAKSAPSISPISKNWPANCPHCSTT